jgi:hypothetical protein
MKYLLLLSIILLAWMVSASSYRSTLTDQKPSLFLNSTFNIFPQFFQPNSPKKIEIQDRNLPSEIRQDLYNSISTGMSYDQVRAIIGWDGILIYENDIDTAEGKIRETVYQWNNEDIYHNDDRYESIDPIGLYWNVTLQFQNNILIQKSSFNLPR